MTHPTTPDTGRAPLEPCPFCGGAAEHIDAGPSLNDRVVCGSCNACSWWFTSRAEAVAAWNRRTPAPATQGLPLTREEVERVARIAHDMAHAEDIAAGKVNWDWLDDDDREAWFEDARGFGLAWQRVRPAAPAATQGLVEAREAGSTEGWKDALEAAWRAMAEPYHGEGADNARARGIKFGREESCRRVDGMRAQIRPPASPQPPSAPGPLEEIEARERASVEHIRGCKECTTARLRAVLNARPPFDNGSRYLNGMCEEGKRLAAYTMLPDEGAAPRVDREAIRALEEAAHGMFAETEGNICLLSEAISATYPAGENQPGPDDFRGEARVILHAQCMHWRAVLASLRSLSLRDERAGGGR